MKISVTAEEIIRFAPPGIDKKEAAIMADRVNQIWGSQIGPQGAPQDAPKTTPLAWQRLSKEILPNQPFDLHQFLFQKNYSQWNPDENGPPPAWIPEEAEISRTHIDLLQKDLGLSSYAELHRWSSDNREEFWQEAIKRVGIVFKSPYRKLLDLSKGIESPRWLDGAKLNISESCFRAPDEWIAVLYQTEQGDMQRMTYGELQALSNRVANGLRKVGFAPGDAIAIDMVMTAEAVAIYLGIVSAGCVVVSIADSFSADEIKTRLELSGAKGIFTQDVILRAGKKIPLYQKVIEAAAPKAIVACAGAKLEAHLRAKDMAWEDFLADSAEFSTVPCDPQAHTNILFSSGTTGEPKAIPWSHTTPIKCAVDGYFHHDIHSGNIVAWPTNLGWMMGPWLIYASLINRATIALFYGAPTGREFGEFVQNARVTMLGLVPSIVKHWRNTDCMKNLDWSGLRCFSSTGECSNAEDYLFLMSLANYRPVIEYCGGTEIGGGFATGTLVQPSSPATFSTAALGLDLEILDENQQPASSGELYLVPPSIGLSNELLNRDHSHIYFEGTPLNADGVKLRRHGDQMERLKKGYFRALGRADDTMNLGGIKVSSAEIERVLNRAEGVVETAAIAINPTGGGPSLLVVYVVSGEGKGNETALKGLLQSTLSQKLNPLFKIHDVKIVSSLPRTASNKVMRRTLRSQYTAVKS